MGIVLCSRRTKISSGLQAWAFSTLFSFSLVFLHAHPRNTAGRKLEKTERAGRSELGITTFRVFLSGQPAVGQFLIQSPMAINFVCSDCWNVNWRKTLPSLSSVTHLPLSRFLYSFSLFCASSQLFATTCSYPPSPSSILCFFPLFFTLSFSCFPMITTGK